MKTTEALVVEFKKLHPRYKCSFRTFRRRRPQHILLSSSRAFLQCLCESCCLKAGEDQCLPLKSVDELVQSTLCKKPLLEDCIDRNCSSCGVQNLTSWRQELQDRLNEKVTWQRWEKTATVAKDQVTNEGTLLSDLMVELEKKIA